MSAAPRSTTIGVPRAARLSASKTSVIESGAPPSWWRGSSGSAAQTLATAPGSFTATETLTVTTCTESAAGSSSERSTTDPGESSTRNRHVREPVVSSRYDSADRNSGVPARVTTTTSCSERPRTAGRGGVPSVASTLWPACSVKRTWKLP